MARRATSPHIVASAAAPSRRPQCRFLAPHPPAAPARRPSSAPASPRLGDGLDAGGRRRRRRGSGWPRALDPRPLSWEVVSPCPHGLRPGEASVAPSNASLGRARKIWAVMRLDLARGGQGRSRVGVPVPGGETYRWRDMKNIWTQILGALVRLKILCRDTLLLVMGRCTRSPGYISRP